MPDIRRIQNNLLSIGTGTAGSQTLRFANNFTLSLVANPTAARTINLPDTSGTLALTANIPDIISISTGSDDANKLALLNGSGIFDSSFIKLPSFILRRISTQQTIFSIYTPEAAANFYRNFVTFPDTVFIDSIYSYNSSNGRVTFSQSGRYLISTSVRIKNTSADMTGLTLEICRRRGSSLLRIRGQEVQYSSPTLKYMALSQTSPIDIVAGDTIGVEVAMDASQNGFIEIDADHSMCEFAGVYLG